MKKNQDRAAIYARYSSHAQDNSVSIEMQLEACRTIAGANPLEFVDRAVSGRTLQRPQFNAMLAAAERGEFSRLICHKFDRLGRTAHAHSVISDLEDLGVEVISATEGDD